MEPGRADPDTQGDVDIMILDYLLCININSVLYGRTVRRQASRIQRQGDWAFDSVHYFRSILRADYTLPQDLRIKLQLLDFANIFFPCYTQLLSPKTPAADSVPFRGDTQTPVEFSTTISDHLQQQSPLTSIPGLKIPSANAHSSWIIPYFMKLCAMAKGKVARTRWVDIIARFIMQDAADQYNQHGNDSPKLLDRCLSWEPEDQYQAVILKEASARCYLQTQACTSLATHLKTISNDRSLFQLEGAVREFLSDLMKALDPPVLLQLERGQLGKLNRAETEQLKRRTGFR